MFAKVKEFFINNNIDINNKVKEFTNEYRFAVFGPRDSVVYYRIWGTEDTPIVDAWFGKHNSESGGLSLQSSANNENQLYYMFKLHKRFMQSGRKKILRNWK